MAAAYTFLQRNPKHELTAKYLSYYRGMLDIGDESLTDLEAQPYEVCREWEGGLALARLPTHTHTLHAHFTSRRGSLDAPLPCSSPGCVPPGCETLQQWGLPQQRRRHGAGPG